MIKFSEPLILQRLEAYKLFKLSGNKNTFIEFCEMMGFENVFEEQDAILLGELNDKI